jgi:hypothetical protein
MTAKTEREFFQRLTELNGALVRLSATVQSISGRWLPDLSDLPDAPASWRDEPDSLLHSAIETYMLRQYMSPEKIAAMRTYVGKFINAPIFAGSGVEELRASLNGVSTWKQMVDWMSRAAQVGCRPL